MKITDYASADLGNYAASETTETYTIADDVVIAVVEERVLTETTSVEIVAGDFLVIYTDDEGVTNIAVYHAEEDSTTWSDKILHSPTRESAFFLYPARKCLHFFHKSSVSIQLALSIQCYFVCEDLHGILHREERYVRFCVQGNRFG